MLQKLMKTLGFTQKTLINFIIIAISSELIYTFIGLRHVLYNPLVEFYGITNAQFGFLLGMPAIISTIFDIPFGWVQDRFSHRKLLTFTLFLTGLMGFALSMAPGYTILVGMFVIFGFAWEVFYWPALLKSVRLTSPDDKQGTAFGLLELLRAATTTVVYGGSSFLLSFFINQHFGLQVVLIVNSIIIILWAVLIWIMIPEQIFIDGATSEEKTKNSFKGLKKAVMNRDIWLIGITGATVYAVYCGLTYFLPYLEDVYALPLGLGAVFGIFNSSGARLLASPISGLVGDNLFKSSTHFLNKLLILTVVMLGVVMMIPKTGNMLMAAVVSLIVVSLICYLMRVLYFVPMGELQIPKEYIGSGMALASLLTYSPQFWSYALYGNFIDRFEPSKAFTYIFGVQAGFAVLGIFTSAVLGRKILKYRALSAEGGK